MTDQVPYSKMIALGSSFASGPGLEPYADGPAMRSMRNYAHLVAEAIGATLIDATVAGATTATILHTPQRRGRHTFPLQLDAVSPDADLVTLTIGGNDLGYVFGVMKAAVADRLRRKLITRPLARLLVAVDRRTEVAAERKQHTTDQVAKTIKALRLRAPGARVVVVDYLPIFTEQSRPGAAVPFSRTEIAYFRRVADALSDVLGEAARRTGADFVPASRYDQTHGIGAAEPWVFGLQPARSLASSFHPTAAGMRAVADVLISELATPGTAG